METVTRGFPQFIRCDNGPELTAKALRDWCRFTGTGTSNVEPALAKPVGGIYGYCLAVPGTA